MNKRKQAMHIRECMTSSRTIELSFYSMLALDRELKMFL